MPDGERYFEDYEPGDRWETNGRTVTDSDIRMFIGATDDTHPAHVDAEYCARHPFGKITAQGTLVLSIAEGLVVHGNVVPHKLKLAHYGYEKVRFLAPVHPGDTVRVAVEVKDLRPKNDEFGIVAFEYRVLNQRDELVLIIEDLQMVERKGDA